MRNIVLILFFLIFIEKLFSKNNLVSSKDSENEHNEEKCDCKPRKQKEKLGKTSLSESDILNINSTLANEIKRSRFYVRGSTNLDSEYTCNKQSRWGPAKDFSYFLYDFEPFEGTTDSRRKRMKRKHEDKQEKTGDNTYDDDDDECDNNSADPEDQYCEDEENGNSESKSNSCEKRAEFTKTTEEKEKHIINRKHNWQNWSPWSLCSKTCGKGTRSRWRHCIANSCPKGEKEAQIEECVVTPCKINEDYR